MKIADRLAVARQCEAIAREHGACVEILPCGILGNERETQVRLEWPTIGVSFEIGGCLAPGVLVHFYRAARPLRHHDIFDSINTHHKRKATTWNESSGRVFIAWFREACKAINNGEIFE